MTIGFTYGCVCFYFITLRSSDGCSDYGYLLRIWAWILAEMGDFWSDFWARNVVFMLCGSKSVSGNCISGKLLRISK